MPNKTANPEKEMPFLDHIGELRIHLIRAIISIFVGAIIVGVFWNYVNDLITAPLSSDFVTFTAFNNVGESLGIGEIFKGPFNVESMLTNLQFSGQFTSLIGVVIVGGIILALPYVVWEFFQFLKPGLTHNERKYSVGIIFSIVFFFLMGVLFSYFMVLPLSIHFMFFFEPFGVPNKWTLGNYISVFVQTTLAMGVVFLLPVIVYFLTKMGILTPQFLKEYRKHAFVVVLSVAALITPADLLSMFVASIPLWLLYELSIIIAQRVYNRQIEPQKGDLTKT